MNKGKDCVDGQDTEKDTGREKVCPLALNWTPALMGGLVVSRSDCLYGSGTETPSSSLKTQMTPCCSCLMVRYLDNRDISWHLGAGWQCSFPPTYHRGPLDENKEGVFSHMIV